jgi:hypothetical protein
VAAFVQRLRITHPGDITATAIAGVERVSIRTPIRARNSRSRGAGDSVVVARNNS